jgi:L-amino acid N-acyltransferase YncA
MEIRPATNADCDEIWKIFHEIIVAGNTYAFDPKMSREEAVAYWFRADTHTYVAEKDGGVVGTYILRPNQLGPGSHVANAAFMVAAGAQASGVGRRMAEHCLSEVRRMGFRAIQFNRDLYKHASDPSMEADRFQNCRNSARRISAS